MADPSALWNLSHEVLDACLDAFTDASVDPPEMQYVTAGNVVIEECEQLTVSGTQILFSTPGADPASFMAVQGKCGAPLSALFTIYASRCAPTLTEVGDGPSVADLDAAAEYFSKDGMILTSGLGALINTGAVLGQCRSAKFLSAVFGGPEGARGWWVITLQVAF